MPRRQKLPISGKKSNSAAKFEKARTAVVEARVEVAIGEAPNVPEVRVGAVVRGARRGLGGATASAHAVLIAGESTAHFLSSYTRRYL